MTSYVMSSVTCTLQCAIHLTSMQQEVSHYVIYGTCQATHSNFPNISSLIALSPLGVSIKLLNLALTLYQGTQGTSCQILQSAETVLIQ